MSALAASSASADVADGAAQNQLIATIRQATARYHRVDAALAAGYELGSPCEAIPGGGIGVHYRKSALFDVVVDPAQPELLVYEPRKTVTSGWWRSRSSCRPRRGTQPTVARPSWGASVCPRGDEGRKQSA
jgi:hypothetical protein